MSKQPQQPLSWTPEKLAESVVVLLTTNIAALLLLHEAMSAFSRDPEMDEGKRRDISRLLVQFEDFFEKAGLEPPAEGWRGENPGGAVTYGQNRRN